MWLKKKTILIVVTAILVNVLFFFCSTPGVGVNYKLNITMEANHPVEVQVYYDNGTDWKEENSVRVKYSEVGATQTLALPINTLTSNIRIDFGTEITSVAVEQLTIGVGKKNTSIRLDEDTKTLTTNMIETVEDSQGGLRFITTGNDPYVIVNLTEEERQAAQGIMNEQHRMLSIIYCVIIDVFFLFVLIYSKRILSIPIEVYRNRKLTYNLARNDLKTRFAGSYFGALWAYVQPIVTILLYWFVFQYAFKNGDVNGYPYVLWLSAGLVPWFFFQEVLVMGTDALIEYSYLVKKVVFQISILPMVKVISSSFVHFFFMGFVLVIYMILGHIPTIHIIQLVYYYFCMIALLAAITYAASAMVLFFRDLGQIINILMQVFMWATPIMWNETRFSPNLVWIFKLNPMYYVIQGYRDSLINKVWFFDRIDITVYFWVVVGLLFVVGTTIFKRLKPHFADVL